jgi:hypothetical protein
MSFIGVILYIKHVIYWGYTLYNFSISSLRGEVWVLKTSSIPPLFIEVPVPKPDKSCIRGIEFLRFYNFLIGFEIIPTCGMFCILILLFIILIFIILLFIQLLN